MNPAFTQLMPECEKAMQDYYSAALCLKGLSLLQEEGFHSHYWNSESSKVAKVRGPSAKQYKSSSQSTFMEYKKYFLCFCSQLYFKMQDKVFAKGPDCLAANI